MCCTSTARAVISLNFNVFLEKARLKNDGSNYPDWVHNVSIVLAVAQKNYVVDALLGAAPYPENPDTMNV